MKNWVINIHIGRCTSLNGQFSECVKNVIHRQVNVSDVMHVNSCY